MSVVRRRLYALREFLALPGAAEIVKYVLVFFLALAFLVALVWGFGQFFIPLLVTTILVVFLLASGAHWRADPVVLVGVLALVFAGTYMIQKLQVFSVPLQAAGLDVGGDPTLAALVVIVLSAAVLVYAFRCALLGMCKR